MSTSTDTTGNPLTVRLDEETREALEKLAARNDRTLSAEVRRAIKRHLAEAVAA